MRHLTLKKSTLRLNRPTTAEYELHTNHRRNTVTHPQAAAVEIAICEHSAALGFAMLEAMEAEDNAS